MGRRQLGHLDGFRSGLNPSERKENAKAQNLFCSSFVTCKLKQKQKQNRDLSVLLLLSLLLILSLFKGRNEKVLLFQTGLGLKIPSELNCSLFRWLNFYQLISTFIKYVMSVLRRKMMEDYKNKWVGFFFLEKILLFIFRCKLFLRRHLV